MWRRENLRKNFLRVKQIADQNLGRAEKSEVLSRGFTVSREAGLQTAGVDMEKRLKKLPEANLAHCMVESAGLLGQDTVMGMLFQLCGDCQNTCAKEMLQYELDLTNNILNPLQDVLDLNEFSPYIACIDLFLFCRWITAMRQTQVHGTNIVSASNKADTIKEEYEEAQSRVEQAKDLLATELFIFISKEAEHSSKLLALLEAQSTYHKSALEAIETLIPKMKSTLDTNQCKPVYGTSLEDHLRVTDRDIALVIEACVCTLIEAGIEEEGLFRIAGMASKVKKLKAEFDANIADLEEFTLDIHTVAGALKQYLRELPEPLLTFKLYSEFLKAAQVPQEQRLQALHDTVEKLPRPHYNNFRYLIKFLAKLTEKSDINKMSASNIGIVIGPNLLWSEGDNGPNMLTSGTVSSIVELFVSHADWFFPGDFDFHNTSRGTAPPYTRGEKSVERPKESLQFPAQSSSAVPKLPSPSSQPGSLNKACGMIYNAAVTPVSSQQDRQSQQSPATSETSGSDIFVDAPSPGLNSENNDDEVDEMEDDRRNTGQGERPNPRGCGSANNLTNKLNQGGKDGSVGSKPQMQSRSLPPRTVTKSFHSDVYSTVFALQSLGGDGADYLSKVRAMWEGQKSNNFELDFCSGSLSSQSSSPLLSERPKSEHIVMERDTLSLNEPPQSQSDSSSDISQSPQPQPQPQSQALVPLQTQMITQNKVLSMSSPPPPPPAGPGGDNNGQPMNVLLAAPLAESEQMSPRAPKRVSKKQAPPPPQRPFSVAVTASVGRSSNQSQTWPRQFSNPAQQEVEEISQEEGKKHSSPPIRPALPPDKPVFNQERNSGDRATLPLTSSDRHGGLPPERPKLPPPIAPQHQRSASTGASPVATPANTLSSDDKGSSSRTCSNDSLNKEVGTTLTSNNMSLITDKLANSNSISRQSSSSRPARPTPPPPPPPSKIIEETHL
ncbi:hypothetical protein ScPMuIL_004840 [Solemya velum]